MKLQKLEKLATERNSPCVTLSLNTHRTHPDSLNDVIMLKNLVNEATSKVLGKYEKRDVAGLIENLQSLEADINPNFNLDSLHIFLSNDTKEIFRSSWPTEDNKVNVSDRFNIRQLIKNQSNSEDYLIMVLSQSGVSLFEASDESIDSEINNEDFPFSDNQHYITHSDKASDAKQVDNMVREYLNKVDKALVKVHNQTGRNCVVICTEDNYSRLQQVADKPSVYLGYAPINYNDFANHTISKQAFDLISAIQKEKRAIAIEEMKEAVGQGKVITDIGEIYKAAREGRGDLLIAHTDYNQPVRIGDNDTIELVTNADGEDAIEDLVSDLAWKVIAQKGRAVFTSQDEIKEVGKIALKVRY